MRRGTLDDARRSGRQGPAAVSDTLKSDSANQGWFRKFGKLFWFVAAAIFTALLGIPISYLVEYATPKPHFHVWAERTNGSTAFVSNESTIAAATSVLVSIEVNYDGGQRTAAWGYPEPPPLSAEMSGVTADSRCKQSSSHVEGGYAQAYIVAFECPTIGRGERFEFSTNSWWLPGLMTVSVSWNGATMVRNFRGKTRKRVIGHVTQQQLDHEQALSSLLRTPPPRKEVGDPIYGVSTYYFEDAGGSCPAPMVCTDHE